MEAPECTKEPVDYFKSNIYVTTECDEHLIRHTIEELGDNRILFETDFPHPDSKYPHAVETFLAQDGVSDESKRKILWDNAIEFYRFPDELIPSEFAEATGTD
jgi:predicted TIM-barrel fold metal-dependent hydrolase